MDLSEELKDARRLLMEATLEPLQGSRFQPTGFPDLGPATYTTPEGVEMLLVESVQSMANRLEAVCWDEGRGDLAEPLKGLPYVKVGLPDGRTTNSILEAHRLNSPYIMRGPKGLEPFPELSVLREGPLDTQALAGATFRYDPNSVLHGVFLEKLAGGLRLQRCLSAFIEAKGVNPADSGGVKTDRVDPTGKLGGGAEAGYGHVPFHRREYVAKEITAHFNLDLAQLRAYRLGDQAENLLLTLALFKIQRFLKDGLRLRTACDLRSMEIQITEPANVAVPSLEQLKSSLPTAIDACSDLFTSPRVTEVEWESTRKGKSARTVRAKEKAEEGEEEAS